jgi:hypothetical protein
MEIVSYMSVSSEEKKRKTQAWLLPTVFLEGLRKGDVVFILTVHFHSRSPLKLI